MFRKDTWAKHERKLDLVGVHDLGPYRDLIHRLQPTDLTAYGWENVEVLNGLTKLQRLHICSNQHMENVDGLKGLNNLKWLSLTYCHALENLDGIKNLTGLESLWVGYGYILQNLDALQKLNNLKSRVSG